VYILYYLTNLRSNWMEIQMRQPVVPHPVKVAVIILLIHWVTSLRSRNHLLVLQSPSLHLTNILNH